MAVFGQLNPSSVVNQLQLQFSALFSALHELEDSYQWSSAYSLAELEGAPFNFPAADAQAILNALADAHDLWMTAQGVTGWPAAALPYNFTASMRAVAGTR